jgi:hypothetical protein
MTVNAVRWAVVDSLHSYTGLPTPTLNFSKLGKNVEAFTLLIQIHYNHYQFYSNELVATALAYICYRVKIGSITPLGWLDLGFIVLELIFYATSRDTIRKYYQRGQQLLSGSPLHSADRRA